MATVWLPFYAGGSIVAAEQHGNRASATPEERAERKHEVSGKGVCCRPSIPGEEISFYTVCGGVELGRVCLADCEFALLVTLTVCALLICGSLVIVSLGFLRRV